MNDYTLLSPNEALTLPAERHGEVQLFYEDLNSLKPYLLDLHEFGLLYFE